MPYSSTEGSRSPCHYQKKQSLTSAHVIPITKRPIDKMTTRSQAQLHQYFKNLVKERFVDEAEDRNNNRKDFVAEKTVRAFTEPLKKVVETKRSTRQAVLTTEHPAPVPRALPISPSDVLAFSQYASNLTTYERKEIHQYPTVYYIGKRGLKKRTPCTSTVSVGPDGQDSKVYGFDDAKGSYIPVINDHIAYRYEVLKIIGKGTFGVVLKAYDHKKTEYVALKIIRNQTRFHNQSKEEIKILTKLLEYDADNKFNVVHMLDSFMFRNHPCIVFELLSLNLFELQRKNNYGGFILSLIRRFAASILRCLSVLSKYDIIHCDLKPENILLKQRERTGIKVIDFGSSCFSSKKIHSYIQSRYYRSPEVILCGKYGPPIDMWSLGCILAELYIGRPLLDGDNEADQLTCMMELLNVPPLAFLNKCKTTKVKQFFDNNGNPLYCSMNRVQGQCKSIYNQRGRERGTPGSKKLLPPCKDDDFKSFIRQCLVWDPADRMTPAQAFEHPFITKRRYGSASPELTLQI